MRQTFKKCTGAVQKQKKCFKIVMPAEAGIRDK